MELPPADEGPFAGDLEDVMALTGDRSAATLLGDGSGQLQASGFPYELG